MKVTRYLTVHFAPRTACVVLEISESVYGQLADAMDKHEGEIKLQITQEMHATTRLITDAK